MTIAGERGVDSTLPVPLSASRTASASLALAPGVYGVVACLDGASLWNICKQSPPRDASPSHHDPPQSNGIAKLPSYLLKLLLHAGDL
jgi:hypothetical protein